MVHLLTAQAPSWTDMNVAGRHLIAFNPLVNGNFLRIACPWLDVQSILHRHHKPIHHLVHAAINGFGRIVR